MTTTTVTQHQPLHPRFSMSPEEEAIQLSPYLSADEPVFHDAPEDAPKLSSSLLDRLPASFQERLFFFVDPETFASLSVLNRHWRHRTNSTLLYSYHLAKCAAGDEEQRRRRWSEYKVADLPHLKKLFAKEARRNLFAVYRHKHSVFRLLAPSTMSASATPYGETSSYCFSSRGSKVAVSTSSRMYVVDLCGAQPEILAAFSLQRRPISVTIAEDGRTLAMLAPERRIATFNLYRGKAQLIQTFLLDEPAVALVLSPDSSLLAVAQSHGIELLALNETQGAAVRRKIACEPVSHLRFADNGVFLLGTSTRSSGSTSTIINAPSQMSAHIGDEEGESSTAETWLSQPLFPSSFGKTTHASTVPGSDSCIIAYDVPAESYGLLDFQRMKFVNSIVTASATIVSSAASTPSMSYDGCLVALPVSGQGVQILTMPLEHLAKSHQRNPSAPRLYKSQGEGKVRSKYHQRWTKLEEKGLETQWITVGGQLNQRLVVTGSIDINGKRRASNIEESTDAGVIHFLDFTFTLDAPRRKEIAIDLMGVDVVPLEEGTMEDANELIFAHSASRIGGNDQPTSAPLVRSVTSAKRNDQHRSSLEKREIALSPDAEQEISPEEQHLDAPYHPADPRPQGTLQRQRTATQARAERPRSMPLEIHTTMRNSSSRGQIPDESDADYWVPPPPEYQKDTDQQLPDVLRESMRPPVIPARSQARKSASTPNLVLDGGQQAVTHSAGASGAPAPPVHARPQRIRTFVANARQSIFGLQGFRRNSKGPNDLTQHDASFRTADPQLPRRDSSESPPLNESPPPLPRPTDSHRRSMLDRPLSITTQFRPINSRSVSQPLERTSPRIPAIPSHSQAPESPATPSPAQVASLHRRQTSGSISSLRSDTSAPPRAAMGAHRRGTNTMSPWASSLLLNTVDEDGHDKRSSAAYVDGTPGPSRPMSLVMNGTGPGNRSSSAPSTPITHANSRYATQEGSKENRPPTRLREASMDGSRSSTSRPNTADTTRRRRSFMPNSRLASIPSVGSLLSGAKGSRANSKSPAAGVQRHGSRRLERNGSVRKTSANTGEKEGFKKMFGRLKRGVMKNLEKV